MSFRFLIQQPLAYVLTLSLGLQGTLISTAHADEADDFIAKTHLAAENLAENNLNMMLLGALQQAVFMNSADPSKALSAMKDQTSVLRSMAAKMNRAYGIANDPSASLSGERLNQLYSEYVNILSRVTSQKLKIDGIRRDGYAFKAVIMNLAEKFLNNLDARCRSGLLVNPYDEIRPSLKAIMPAYEVQLAFELGDGQGFQMDPSKSGLSLARTQEEKAMWALFYAGNVILSTYAITGSWVLSAEKFGELALGTQMSALGMALGITAAVAAIIVAVQISQARDAAKKAANQQRRMFEKRADHNTVNRHFTAKCNSARTSFAGLSEALEKIASGDIVALQDLESSRADMKAKIQNFLAPLKAYAEARRRILGEGFESRSKEDQEKLTSQLEESKESKDFYEVSKKLKPEDIGQMITFIFKDLYSGGVDHAAKLEVAYQQTTNLIDSGKAEGRANLLRTMAGQKNLEEIQMQTTVDLKAELKQSLELAGIYSALDEVIVDLAEVVFAGGEDLKTKIVEVEQRLSQIDGRIQEALARYPKSELLKFLKTKLSQVHHSVNSAGTL